MPKNWAPPLQDWDPQGYGVPVTTLAGLFETVESVRAVKVEVVLAGRKSRLRYTGHAFRKATPELGQQLSFWILRR